MYRLLNLKSWQTFGLIVIMPLLLMILGGILSKTTEIRTFSTIAALAAALTMVVTYYGWIFCAGVKLNNQDLSENKLNLSLFKTLFILALILFIVVNPILKKTFAEESVIFTRINGLISFISFLYCIYFVTKSLRNIEKERNIKSGNIFLDFMIIWILPVGIWTIQPRISRIFSDKNEVIETT
jgi:hypothetical protein